MRVLLGWVVLIVGVGALALWGRADHAKRIEEHIRQSPAVLTPKSTQNATATVSGRDISVEGWVGSTAERQALIADLNAVEGRRVVVDNLKLLPAADPYVFTGTKKDGQFAYEGNVPSAHPDTNYEAALGISGAKLKPARGMPDDNWLTVAGQAISALSLANEGRFQLAGRKVTLKGSVNDPAGRGELENALANLPEGYSADIELDVLDDGTPASLAISFSAHEGAEISGKAPEGLGAEELAKLLGLQALSGRASPSRQPGAEAMRSQLSTLGAWMPFFESMSLTIEAAGISIDGSLGKGADRELIEKRLSGLLGEGAKIVFRDADPAGNEGEERVHAATGQKQVFQNGYWLPLREFAISRDACHENTADILRGSTINFVTGSDRLGPRAVQIINELAATLSHCMTDPSLSVEVGGHTDSQGKAASNLDLSNRRAAAVVKSLAERGVPQWSMQAKGYGETSPIAGNNTAEGRAQNRRTTFIWSQN